MKKVKIPKQLAAIAALALCILTWTACGSGTEAPGMQEAFTGVLDGSAAFFEYDGSSVKEITLSQYCKAYGESLPASVTEVATVDLEQDQIPEVLLRIALGENSNVGVLVLHWENEQVYGYTLSDRQMREIRADGTFVWSGSASNYGVATASFCQGDFTCNSLLWVEEVEGSAKFYQDGTEITGDVFFAQLDRHSALAEPQWTAYPADEYQSLFEDMKK